jgi:RND family efflux transporter MFP subunit
MIPPELNGIDRMRYIKQTVGALVAAAMLMGCDAQPQMGAASPETAPQASSPVAVTTVVPELAELSEPIFVTGTIIARRSTNISPMVGGLIEEIFVNVGARVEKGQPLLRMRQKDFEINVLRLSEAKRLAEAEYQDAERDLDNAIALKEKQAFSVEQLDDRRTQVDVSSAKLGIASANLAEAQKELDDSITRAPYRGVITQKNVDEGAYIPSIMRSERPVLQIQQINIMVALVLVPEVYLNVIQLGTLGKVHIPSMNQTYKSEVALINDRIDHKTRTIDVRLGIPNEDYAIKPGLFIEVELTPIARQGLVLPPDATKGLGSSRSVLVVEDGVVREQTVQIRELIDGRLEVIQGISSNAILVVGPSMHDVSDGSRVVISEHPYVDS